MSGRQFSSAAAARHTSSSKTNEACMAIQASTVSRSRSAISSPPSARGLANPAASAMELTLHEHHHDARDEEPHERDEPHPALRQLADGEGTGHAIHGFGGDEKHLPDGIRLVSYEHAHDEAANDEPLRGGEKEIDRVEGGVHEP